MYHAYIAMTLSCCYFKMLGVTVVLRDIGFVVLVLELSLSGVRVRSCWRHIMNWKGFPPRFSESLCWMVLAPLNVFQDLPVKSSSPAVSSVGSFLFTDLICLLEGALFRRSIQQQR